MEPTSLPYVDEHAIELEAGLDDTWAALLHTLDGTFSRRGAAAYARLVGCQPAGASGPRPLDEGSTVPGFRVTAVRRHELLRLEGRHRFSIYALTFRLAAVAGGRTQLTAESRAAFPGVLGRAYRLLVLGTRGHVVGVRGLLASVRRRTSHA